MTLELTASPRRRPGATPSTSGAAATSPDPRPRHPGPARVLAVVVAGPPGADVAATLTALAAQSRRPDSVVGVDASGTGGHVATLRTHLDHVVTTHTAGLGDAVRAGIDAHDAGALAPRPDPHVPDPRAPGRPAVAGRTWVWMLNGGGVPAPDALSRLLDAVEVAPSVAVAGCKHRDSDRLVDAGLTLSRFGRPLTGIEAGDVDQGQLDHREDVLAVGSDGMLLRRDVWDDLGGFDPALHGHAADVDLCRRAWRAGHRVTLAASAVLGRPTPHRWDRRQLVHLRLASAPLPAVPFVVLGVLAGALARLLVRVAAKEPARGLTEVGAVLAVLVRPDRLWRSRRAAAVTAVRPRGAITGLLAGPREVTRWHRARWHARRAAASPAAQPRPPRRWRPALALVGVLSLYSAVSLHRLAGPGEITGAGLAAAPDTLGQLWFAAMSSWGAVGMGTPGPPDPFLAVLSGVAVLAGGSPALAVAGLLLLAVPLAGLGAWLAAGEGTASLAVRGWVALAWAAAPALLVAVDAGRLPLVVAHAALPWCVWGVARAVAARGTRSGWTAAAAAGLALTVVGAAAPLLVVAAVLMLVAVGLTWPRRALPLVWTPLPALAVLAPLLVAALDDPRLLLPASGGAAPPGWTLLLGHVDVPGVWALPGQVWGAELGGVVPLAASGAVLPVALLALFRGGARAAVARLGWCAALLGLATSVLTVRAGGGPGAGVSLMTAGLLVAGVVGADGVRDRMAPHAFGWRQAGAALVTAVAVAGPLATAGAWAVVQAGGASASSVARGTTPVLPEVAVDGATSPDRSRTLVLAATDGGVSASLVRDDGPGLEDAETPTAAADAATGAVDAAVAALVAGAADARPQLSAVAASHVLVLPGDGAERVSAALDGLPGLARAGSVEGATLWRVQPGSGEGRDAADRAARARVVGPETVRALPSHAVAVDTRIDPGPAGRLLVLAERSDPGWWAELDGLRLEPVVQAGWAQAFALPESGGTLHVDHATPGERLTPVLAGSTLVLTLLLAVPVPAALRRLQGRR